MGEEAMPDMDFAGLGRAAEAAFKPHFADVVRRHARRRRQVRVAGAAFVVTAVGVGGGAVAMSGGEASGPLPGGGAVSTPALVSPEGTPGPATAKPATGPMVVGDLDHLYVRWEDCRTGTCTLNVAATADAGGTWRHHPLPVGHDALVDLRAVGPRTLVAWAQEGRFPAVQTWHASADAGATWREVSPRGAAAVPKGWVALGGFDQFEGILAADPATGDLVSLPPRRLEMPAVLGGVPPSTGLWVSGFAKTETATDGRTLGVGAVLEWSRDGGRVWKRYAFPERLVTSDGGYGSVAVATDDGRTAYAVGRLGIALRIYRTTDGGRTWARTRAEFEVGSRPITAAMGPQGRLMIQVGPEGEQPALLLESTDGGATVRAVPAAPGGAAIQVPGGYAQSGWPWSRGAWLSQDAVTWRYVEPPSVP